MIEISAIISTYNRAHFLDVLFDSITKQTIAPDRFEVVIVNNNCTDNTEDVCQKFRTENPSVKVFYCIETQQGLSYGRNRGIAESKGRIVTFLDDDAFLAPDFFETTLNFFDKHNEINAIGGKILLHYMEKKPSWYNPYLASLLGYFNPGDNEGPFGKHNYFRGSNMSFRKEIFEKYGDFNTSLGRVGKSLFGNEEKELYFRFKDKGEAMWYVPSAVVYHLVPIERTYSDFVKRQAIGTGASQRQHALIKGKWHILLAVLSEAAKWAATFLLAFFYMLTLRLSIASMLVRFRWWVSKGIIYIGQTK
jgi:glucosyl-dolichyl phosphate glucuronosyltransferase